MKFFSFNKKPSHLRGECRHQFRVLGKFKRGVYVAHENWLYVKEGTPLLGECPLHPKDIYYTIFKFGLSITLYNINEFVGVYMRSPHLPYKRVSRTLSYVWLKLTRYDFNFSKKQSKTHFIN
ncbi:hypothetical protein Hanom_Chr14g01267501 [Helianthus anomalus]